MNLAIYYIPKLTEVPPADTYLPSPEPYPPMSEPSQVLMTPVTVVVPAQLVQQPVLPILPHLLKNPSIEDHELSECPTKQCTSEKLKTNFGLQMLPLQEDLIIQPQLKIIHRTFCGKFFHLPDKVASSWVC